MLINNNSEILLSVLFVVIVLFAVYKLGSIGKDRVNEKETAREIKNSELNRLHDQNKIKQYACREEGYDYFIIRIEVEDKRKLEWVKVRFKAVSEREKLELKN